MQVWAATKSLVPKIHRVCVRVWRSPLGCCVPSSFTGRAPDALLVWPHWQPINPQHQWAFFWCFVVYKYRACALPLHTTFLENGSTEVKINYADLPVLACWTVEPFKDNEAICQTQNYVCLMSVNFNCIHELSWISIHSEYRANLWCWELNEGGFA